MTETWTDGNSIGGTLRDVFSVDMTAATGRCAGCGNTGPLAEGRVFSHAPGLVLRCPACGEALLRLTRPRPRMARHARPGIHRTGGTRLGAGWASFLRRAARRHCGMVALRQQDCKTLAVPLGSHAVDRL
jgi:Family of unknown function (DUF6510)